MEKTATFNFRLDPEIRDRAQKVYAKWGLSLADALNMFMVKSIDVGGFPFDVRDDAEPFSSEVEAERFVAEKARRLVNEAW